MLAEPALQGEMLRAGAIAEVELAAAVAERSGTDLKRDLYPHLVAAIARPSTRRRSTSCAPIRQYRWNGYSPMRWPNSLQACRRPDLANATHPPVRPTPLRLTGHSFL